MKIPMNRWKWAPWGVLLIVLAVFVATALGIAARKPMWFDEIFAWDNSIKVPVLDTVLHGAGHQASSAPLDYVFLRILYLSRDHVAYFGLHPLQYLRFHCLLIASLLALWLCSVIIQEDGIAGGGLFVAALIPFLFHGSVFSFMTEMRPYGLWVVLSLGVIFTLERARRRPAAWALLVAALALTATASLVQLVALAVSVVTVRILSDRRVDLAILKDPRLLVLLGGLVISAYYARLEQQPYRPQWQPQWSELFPHWRPFALWLPVGALLSAYHVWRRRADRAASCLAASLWLALGPVVVWLTQWRGYFFAPRQLLFMHAAIALLTFETLRIGWVELGNRKRLRGLVMALAVVLSTARVVPGVPLTWRALKRPPEPLRAEILNSRIPHAIPERHELRMLDAIPSDWSQGWWRVGDLNFCGQTSFDIWWEYLNHVYPPEEYPRVRGSTLVVELYDARAYCQPPCVGLALLGIRD